MTNKDVGAADIPAHPSTDNKLLTRTRDLVKVLASDLNACDMKWTLFVAAASSYRYDSQFKPFPVDYLTPDTSLNINQLLGVIDQVPPMHLLLHHLNQIQRKSSEEIEDFMRINGDIVNLMHWLLISVRDPFLKSIDRTEVSAVALKTRNNIP